MLGNGIVIHHGVHVAAGHQKPQPGTSEYVDGSGIFPVRLRNDANAVAIVFQNPADDGVTEGGVVYIGIADDIYEVTAFPAPLRHFFFVDG